MDPRSLKLDDRLREWATPTQAGYMDAIALHGGLRAASKAIGKDHSQVAAAIRRLKAFAASKGYSPDHGLNSPVPEPYVAKGHSTLERIDPKTGAREQVLQWTKTRLDDQRYLELIRDAVAAFVQDVPALPIAAAPLDYDTDIIPWIEIGDAHLGMLAHAAEVGENFDLKIAETELCCAIGMLIDELPPCERIVINDLGDFTHYENMKGETEASGHKLDYDGRFPKMIKVYSRVMRWVVEKALEKARHVDVIVNQGNHSRTNDIWMAELLRVAYGHTGRVHVLNNDSVFIAYRMGKTLVMVHHSDTCRPNRLAGVMTTDFRKDFGETDFHYIDIGHVHHGMVMKEHPSIVIESFNHLAALDKWAHDGGYRNRKSITIILRSRTYGEKGRRLLPIEEVRDRLGKAFAAGAGQGKEAFAV
jgi:hypothetical protein